MRLPNAKDHKLADLARENGCEPFWFDGSAGKTTCTTATNSARASPRSQRREPEMRITDVRLEFEPRDLWIGVYWCRRVLSRDFSEWKIYVCIVPCFPIVVEANHLKRLR